MLEMLINPKKAERKPWEMFFVGLVYAALSVFLVDWIFLNDFVLSKYTSIFIVTFTVMFSIPFMYYIIRYEEKKDTVIDSERSLLKEHGKAIAALMYLFLGFIVAFSILYMVLPQETTAKNFEAQVSQYCSINMPSQIQECIDHYLSGKAISAEITGQSASTEHLLAIFINNIYVMIFVLIFSLAFGAGAIFILVWNAGVIAAAIGIFTEASLKHLHIGLFRYMIHGIPEIAAYFIAALAGGILSTAVIRHDFKSDKFWIVMRDSIDLVVIAIIVLVAAALVEVFITPSFF